MPHQVRRVLYSSLFAAVLTSGLTAGIGASIAGAVLLHNYMDRSVAARGAEAVERLKAFDLAVGSALRQSRETGREALAALGAEFPDRRSADKADAASLHALANALGVDEIYLVGADGRIFATSFVPDQGLDLFSLSPSFVAFLKGVFRSGKMSEQQISGSTQTGNINSYQYYGNTRGDLVIEVSTRMRHFIAAANPGYGYEDFVELFFSQPADASRRSPVSIDDYVDLATGVSWIWEGKRNASIARRQTSGHFVRAGDSWKEGDDRIVLVPAELSAYEPGGWTPAIVLRLDESYYRVFIAVSALIPLLSIGIASIVSYRGARKLLERTITSRIEALEAAMDKVGRGDSAALLEDGQDDELSSIGRNAARMVGIIRADAGELKAFARQLEEEISEREKRERELEASLDANRDLLHEVDHRVKNNLQVMASLARLEASRGRGEEALDVLAKMESRLIGMAFVEDQLLANPSLGRVDMGGLLVELADAVSHGFPAVRGRVRCLVEANSLAFRAEPAIAVALSARELLDNAYRHAFPDGRAGEIRLSLAPAGEDACILDVADNGIGLPEGGVEEALGYSILRAVLAQAGGRIESAERSDGGGCRVRIFIALSENR